MTTVDVPALLADLTLEEKATLCSGAEFWGPSSAQVPRPSW